MVTLAKRRYCSRNLCVVKSPSDHPCRTYVLMGRKAPKPVEQPGFVKKTHARCEDCDIRGDLSTTGKPIVWIRVSRCQTCAGRGEIPLKGTESIDPYARKSARVSKYMVRKPWDSEAHPWQSPGATARFDAIARIMETPPGGLNHGRAKIDGLPVDDLGSTWRMLETEGYDSPSIKRFQGTRKHGTSYTYVKIGCRCPLCRRWKQGYNEAQYLQRKFSNPIE